MDTMTEKADRQPAQGLLQVLRGRFRPLITTAVLYLVLASLLRTTLWLIFGRQFTVPVSQLPGLLIIGIVNDLIVLPPLLLPLSLLLLIVPGWRNSSRIRFYLSHLLSLATIFAMVYLGFTQYFFFKEFNSRFNLVAVNYLLYPYEVFVNIWQSYHVLWFLFATLAIAVLVQLFFASWLVRPKMPAAPFKSRLKLVTLHLLLAVATVTFFSTDTLLAFPNRVANEIGANGISSFARAFHTNELDYNQYYRTMLPDAAFSLMRQQLQLQGQQMNKPSRDLNRTFPAPVNGLGKLNIVLIVEESFGAQFIGTYGNQRGLTPSFDRLAKEGILFANTYASGTRTVRGLSAIVTSLPPIPSEGIMKRPGSSHLANWGTVLQQQGYTTSFLYGGHSLFDNMKSFFSGNGFAVSDFADIKDITSRNIWGVCDEDLFKHADNYFTESEAEGSPFFSVIMTTSNHQPYTFPENTAGIPRSGGGRIAGIRYADYALGRFIEHAKTTTWGKNTLFVIVADHDDRVYGSQLIPMRHYRIPLLILAPGHLKAKVVQTRTGQIDIAPTVMALLGLPFTAPFYGQDILHWPGEKKRPILINHGRDVGLLSGKKLVVLGLNKAAAVFDYDASRDTLTRVKEESALLDAATAYYQTAFILFRSGQYQLNPVSQSAPVNH